jgi:hypothetical protein
MMTIEAVAYMDRRLTESSTGVSSVYAGGVTTWTVPYAVAVDGSEGDLRVALRDTQELLTCTRPAVNQVAAVGDYTGNFAYIGVLYPFTYVPTQLFKRDRYGEPDLTGELLLHRVKVLFSETTDISVTLRRSKRLKQVINKVLARALSGVLTVPTHAKSKDTRIEITSTSPGARALTGIVWEGEWETTNRRV